eukprot:4291976-Prymnesium_polylepis.1
MKCSKNGWWWWPSGQPACAMVDCGAINASVSARVDTSNCVGTVYNATCTVSCAYGYDDDNDVSTTDTAVLRCGSNSSWVSTPDGFSCPYTDYVQHYTSYQSYKGTGNTHAVTFTIAGTATDYTSYRYCMLQRLKPWLSGSTGC